ncbi:hypothetical protein [Ruegeria arenilitoris]|uniref:hypothetical protein n=1 Tax=Ruegeria arenilitoris TaxID=1173585 RepID=UPI00147E8BFD|nr:hypothetical protein [Ruegeria arenilitoris]
MRTTIPIAIMMLAASTMISVAETNRDTSSKKHKMHMHAQMHGDAGLKEPGQGAFAALSEVVRVLETDPETDWSKVDLSGLREHLVDMDRLVTGSIVNETPLPDGLRAFATGDADTLASLKRMVPEHAGQLARDDHWTVSVQESDEGVELTVTSEDDAVVARIKGLGFFGLMASQDHHREHHLLMARGEDAHAH